jgi:hypothetical protein
MKPEHHELIRRLRAAFDESKGAGRLQRRVQPLRRNGRCSRKWTKKR